MSISTTSPILTCENMEKKEIYLKAIQALGLTWQKDRVLGYSFEAFPFEANPEAYAINNNEDLLQSFEKQGYLSLPEWLISRLQVIIREALEAFLNSHDLGLDGGEIAIPNKNWRYIHHARAAEPYLKRLLDLGAPLENVEIERQKVPAIYNEYALERTAAFIASWYKNMEAALNWANIKTTPCSISLPKRFDRADYTKETTHEREIITQFVEVIQKRMALIFKYFFLHGSYGTEDFISKSSDIDTYAFVKKEITSSKNALLLAREVLIEAWPYFYSIDPLQHHGIMLAAEQDLLFFPECFFPDTLTEHSQTILGKQGYTYQKRIDEFEKKSIIFSILQNVRWHQTGNTNHFKLEKAFFYKHYINLILLSVPLLLQNNHGYMYKKYAFPKLRKILPKEFMEIIDIASHIRSEKLYAIDITWPHPLSQKVSTEQVAAFHALARTVPTPQIALKTSGTLYVDKVAMVTEHLLSLEGANIGKLDEKWEPNEPCIRTEMGSYTKFRNRIIEYTKNNLTDIDVGFFGAVSSPGISDLDVLFCVKNKEAAKQLNKITQTLQLLHPEGKYILDHSPSFVISKHTAAFLGKIYPIFNSIQWYGHHGDYTQNIAEKEVWKEHLVALAEMSLSYFMRPEIKAIISKTFFARRTLLRGWGLSHSARVLENANFDSTEIIEITKRIKDLRQKWFHLNKKEQREGLDVINDECLLAELEIYRGLKECLPTVIDCTQLGTFNTHHVVGMFSDDVFFVTQWSKEIAIKEIRKLTLAHKKPFLILPAEIAILLKSYQTSNGPVGDFFRAHFSSRDLTGNPLPNWLNQRLKTMTTILSDLKEWGLLWAGIPQFGTFQGESLEKGAHHSLFENIRGEGLDVIDNYFAKIAGDKEKIDDIRQALNNSKYTHSTTLALRYLEENPISGEAWYLLGVAQNCLADHEQALFSFQKALQNGWSVYWTLRCRFQTNISRGQRSEAQKDYENCMRAAETEDQKREMDDIYNLLTQNSITH